MAEKYSSLNHAAHNEKICIELSNNHQNSDWVITIAFYSALHYVMHKIFPFKFIYNGKNLEADNFVQYCNLTDQRDKKHKLVRKLVEDNVQEDIAAAYNQMLDMSWTARYHRYQFSKDMASLAVKRLKAIKNHCNNK